MSIESKVGEKCCGCAACMNKCPKDAITMVEDEKGFRYPKINQEKCIECGLCEKSCPVIQNKKIENEPKVYACISKDEEERLKSSSGGIFSLLSKEILERKGVVFGAAFDEEFLVRHQYIENINDLDKLRTSKYLQSIIGNTYRQAKEFLEQGRYVLYTGTPCQIEGLLSYLGKEYEKLYTQDIVCHGVPSPKVWRKYMEFRKNKDKEVPTKINFRDKKQGWKTYSVTFQYKNSKYSANQTEDIYMKAFLRDICLRDSCYQCSFRKEKRLSDITLADFWGVNKILPEWDDNKGTSLVLINSKKGEEIYQKISEKLKSKEVTMENALMSNPAIMYSPKIHKNREKFFGELGQKQFEELVKQYATEPKLIVRLRRKLKRIVGSKMRTKG